MDTIIPGAGSATTGVRDERVIDRTIAADRARAHEGVDRVLDADEQLRREQFRSFHVVEDGKAREAGFIERNPKTAVVVGAGAAAGLGIWGTLRYLSRNPEVLPDSAPVQAAAAGMTILGAIFG